MELYGRVAAVTGAASGIGRGLAIALAAKGADLAVSDVDEVGLAETVDLVTRSGRKASRTVTVTAQHLDVADRDAVHGWADEVVSDHGRANLIVNNAGVALGATVDGMSYDDFDWLMGVNLQGVVAGTKAFLPHLKAAGEGHVVNISSVFGLVGIPTQSAYNAAKFAVRGFTEALRVELDIEDCGVSATTVHPGGIKTNIARSARVDASITDIGLDVDETMSQFEKLFITTPDRAARAIVRAVEKDKRRLLIGPDAWAVSLLSKLPPGTYQGALARGAGRGL